MLTFALQTLRSRIAGFVGAFVALMCAAAMVTACGMLLDTGLRGKIPVERYAGTSIVVAGDQQVHWTTTKNKPDGEGRAVPPETEGTYPQESGRPSVPSDTDGEGRAVPPETEGTYPQESGRPSVPSDTDGEVKEKTKSKPLTERAWIPADLASTVGAVPGVSTVVTEVTFPAYVLDSHGVPVPGPDSWGHGIESAPLTPFTTTTGRTPTAPGEIAIDTALASRAGIAVGDSVSVQSTTTPGTYTVVGLVAPDFGELGQQSTVFFSTDEARTLAGRDGQVTAIGVVPTPGTDVGQLGDAITTALSGTPGKVYVGEARGPLEFIDADSARVKLISMGGAIGGISLLVGILVVVGTFALSIQQRYREIALLRAIAATPKQMRQLIGRESLLVGLIAAPIGAFGGIFLATWLRDRFVSYGVMPSSLELVISPFPVIAAVAATLGAAFLAARISARHIIRIRPTEALSDAAMSAPKTGFVRILAGILCLAGGVVLLVVLSGLTKEAAASPVTFLTAMMWVFALSLLSPLIAKASAWLFTPLLQWVLRASGHLAAANARTSARRLASVITPLGLLVALTVTILFVPTTMGDAAAEEQRVGTVADYTLTGPTPGIPSAATEAVRGLDGVEAATEVLGTTVRIDEVKYRAQGVTTQGLSNTMDLGVQEGSIDNLNDQSIATSALSAEEQGVHIGDQIDVTMGDGVHVTLTLVAVYGRHLGFGDLTLPQPVVAAHIDNALASTVLIAGSVTPAQIQGVLGKAYPAVAVLNQAEVEGARDAASQANAEIQLIAMGLVIAFAAIAVVNTLAMATADRAREFALLRLVGTTRRQVLRMLRAETGVAVLTAVVLGSAIALATLTSFSVAMTGAAQPSGSLWKYATVIVSAALLAFVATALPARVALRGRPADVIGGRQ